ncbi:MAG: permease prefix domain 2-containing transporter [Terriglobales bacterium]
MTSPEHFEQPPRLASWLVSLFAPAEEAESIPGDLVEEFSLLVSRSGTAAARRWYWRQAVKSTIHLFGNGVRGAPWSTLAYVTGGFLLLRFVGGLPDKLLSAVTDRYLPFWSTHFKAYTLVLNAILALHLVVSLFVGCMVGLAAKGREMIATTALTLVLCSLIGVAFVSIATHQPPDLAWMLWSCADPLAVMAGGIFVRTRRLAGTTPTLDA